MALRYLHRAPGRRLLAESDLCPQAFLAGRSMGLRFHPEVTPEIAKRWVEGAVGELEARGVDAGAPA